MEKGAYWVEDFNFVLLEAVVTVREIFFVRELEDFTLGMVVVET